MNREISDTGQLLLWMCLTFKLFVYNTEDAAELNQSFALRWHQFNGS